MSIIDYIIIDPINQITYFDESEIPSIVLSNPNIKLIRQCKNSKYVFVPGRGCVKRCFINDKNKKFSILNEVTIEGTTISLTPYYPKFNHGASYYSTNNGFVQKPLSESLKKLISNKFPEVKVENLQLSSDIVDVDLIDGNITTAQDIFFQLVLKLAFLNDPNDPIDFNDLKVYNRSTRLRLSYYAFRELAARMADIGLSEDAKKAWTNYLNASGDKLQIDLKKLYDEDTYYFSRLENIKNIYVKAIKILHSSNPNIATSVEGSQNKFFTLYAKQLYNVSSATENNSKIIIGAHNLRTWCYVSWNSDTETYLCTLNVETEDLWDANEDGIQNFWIPTDTITVDTIGGYSVTFDLKSRIPSIVNIMDWGRDDSDDDTPTASIRYNERAHTLSVDDKAFGIFETFGLAKPFLVYGSFSTQFEFNGSNMYEKSECCPIPPEYSSYNSETKECECGFSDENEIYKKHKLITNYIYTDPEKVRVSAVSEESSKTFFKQNNNKAEIPIIAYCDCPGDLSLNLIEAMPQQLIDNPDKSFYLYCTCPYGTIPDPEDDTKCVCVNAEFNKALCEEIGYHDYVSVKEASNDEKYNIFVSTYGDTFFPFDYKQLKKGCECICYEDYAYDVDLEKCLCSKEVIYFLNIDPTVIEHKNFHLFNPTNTPVVRNIRDSLSTVSGLCACSQGTEPTIIDDTILYCRCKKANTYWDTINSVSYGNCICLPGLFEHPDTGECVCEEGKIYDYKLLECVPANPSESSSSSSSNSSSSSSSSSHSDPSTSSSISSSNTYSSSFYYDPSSSLS